jgi:tRNA C32,U32 (ribose-2'-O)-methylase TrmJ
LIHIPADEGYPALNLAQALAICLYEIRCAWLEMSLPIGTTKDPPASHGYLQRMLQDLQKSLEHIGYLRGPGTLALMHALRHLISRAQPNEMEVDILWGLARQIEWFAEQDKGNSKSLGLTSRRLTQ